MSQIANIENAAEAFGQISRAENGSLIATFMGQPIRTVMKRTQDNELKPWFCMADVCKLINKRPNDKMNVLRDCESGHETFVCRSQRRNMAVCSESGLYLTLLRCQDALKEGTVAFRFRIWVTDHLLPELRKTGSYNISQHPEHIAALHDLNTAQQQAIQALQNLQVANQVVHEQGVAIRNTIWNICHRANPQISYNLVNKSPQLYAQLCREGHAIPSSPGGNSFFIREGHEHPAEAIIRQYIIQFVDSDSDSE